MAAEVSPFRAAKAKEPDTVLEPMLAALMEAVLTQARAEMTATLASETAVLRAELAQAVQRGQAIPAPQVTVEVPESEVELNLEEILPVLKEIRDVLKKAQVRTVDRDGDGRITTITDRRT